MDSVRLQFDGIDQDVDRGAQLGRIPAFSEESPRREFQPWHRPRKQFVRENQWIGEIEELVERGGVREGVLKYLTLPGSDYLDIRSIHERVCVKNGLTLRYLGFNTALSGKLEDQADGNRNEFSVKRLEYIDKNSAVIADDIRRVAVKRSPAWSAIATSGTFHAINLDLCDSFFDNPGEGQESYFGALDWILETQGRANHEFVLFITTRIDTTNVEDEILSKVRGYFEEALQQCGQFGVEIKTQFGLRDDVEGTQISERMSDEMRMIFGLMRWVIMRSVGNKLSARLCGAMSYRVKREGDDDLMSIVIRFKPEFKLAHDPSGFSVSASDPSPEVDQCKELMHLPKRMVKCVKVDALLATDPDVRQLCVEDSVRLLGLAGYDSTAYIEWLSEVEGSLG